MRIKRTYQLFFKYNRPEINKTAELQEVSEIISKLPRINELYEEILRDCSCGQKSTGSEGMTAEQILKFSYLQSRYQMTYRELGTATEDSISIRDFLGLEGNKSYKKSAIHQNLKKLSETTMRLINDSIKDYAIATKIEDGSIVRADTTATKANVHYPTDASLLCDSVRVITRALERVQYFTKIKLETSNHHQSAKSHLYKINNGKNQKKRHNSYLELIRIARKTLRYAKESLTKIAIYQPCNKEEMTQIESALTTLKANISLVEKVINQAYRRIVKKENVPTNEKIFSIFEPEVDIIIKGQRDIVFGHKVLVSTGKSSLMLEVSVLDGNPADSSLVESIIDNHINFYGKAPDKMAFDGGFSSIENRDYAKNVGVKEITFCKNKGMQLQSLVSSRLMHKMLLNFRAGVEGCISFLKRTFGFDRVITKTKNTFKAVLQMGAVAYNLTLLARLQLQNNP